MLRRYLFAIALVGCLCAGRLLATERATFILTDGERISGNVVFHTNTRENLIDGDLNIGTGDGKEQSIHVTQVAVIDFVGGKPPVTELAALPSGPNQMLALRNGTTRPGSFVNLIGGDTVRWKNAGGDTQELPIRDVTRIYLNADSARIAFDYTPAPLAPQTGSQIGKQPKPSDRGQLSGNATTIDIPATVVWTDSGLTVTKGERITFSATGTIAYGRGPGDTSGPDGNAQLLRGSYPVKGVGAGALIGRVGLGAPFFVGAGGQPIVMPAKGRLLLGVNDDKLDDNSGSFRVTIMRGQ